MCQEGAFTTIQSGVRSPWVHRTPNVLSRLWGTLAVIALAGIFAVQSCE